MQSARFGKSKEPRSRSPVPKPERMRFQIPAAFGIPRRPKREGRLCHAGRVPGKVGYSFRRRGRRTAHGPSFSRFSTWSGCLYPGRQGWFGGGGFKSAIYGNKNVGNQSLPLPLHEWKKSPDLVGVQTVHCLGKTYLHVPASASYGCKKA